MAQEVGTGVGLEVAAPSGSPSCGRETHELTTSAGSVVLCSDVLKNYVTYLNMNIFTAAPKQKYCTVPLLTDVNILLLQMRCKISLLNCRYKNFLWIRNICISEIYICQYIYIFLIIL